MIKNAVIVAAGLSSRLYPLTHNKPKCLLEVNGEEIIQRSVRILKNAGIKNIFLVIGYLKNQIEEVLGDQVTYIYNPYFKHCNNMGSLYMAKAQAEEQSFLYLHGDIIYTEELLRGFVEQAQPSEAVVNLAVDFKETDEEAMKVKVDVNNYLIKSDKSISFEESAGEWIGIAAIHNSNVVFNYIEQVLVEEKLNMYDTFAFSRMAQEDFKISCIPTSGEKWVEIDFVEDYERAKRMFENEIVL